MIVAFKNHSLPVFISIHHHEFEKRMQENCVKLLAVKNHIRIPDLFFLQNFISIVVLIWSIWAHIFLALYRVFQIHLMIHSKSSFRKKTKTWERDIQTEKQKNYWHFIFFCLFILISDHSLALFVSVVAICRFVVCTSCVAFFCWFARDYFLHFIFFVFFKVEKIWKGILDLIPSPSAKIQIMGGKVFLRCKGKTLLGIVDKLLKTKSLVTSPSNVLPYYLM